MKYMDAIDFLRKEYSVTGDTMLVDVIGVNMKLDIVIRLMDRYADTKQKLNIHGVMQGCQCKDRIGETKVWCCNQCGLPCEDFWLPTHYTVGSRTVGKAGGDASVSDGK